VRDLQSGLAAISEVAAFLRDYGEEVEFDPERIEEVRERLGAFELLKRKYGGTIEAVIEHRERLGADVKVGENLEDTLRQLKEDRIRAEKELGAVAGTLSEKRAHAAPGIQKAVVVELAALGMPDAVFDIVLQQHEDPEGWADSGPSGRFNARPDGIDECAFLISTNRGEPAKALARVASGGEVSRVMLALKKVMAGGDRVPTLVFDEIDTGISGAIAQKVGLAMRRLSNDHQIIAITHLPQIAAMAATHYRVRKDDQNGRNVTTIERLSSIERTQEVATLLSGAEISDSAMRSAEELISLATQTV
jgi:DNA repair protein RecN (Recombination protein N)